MAAQITIIGTGQIGASVGLALAAHGDKLKRIGHDRELAIARRAEKMGALDRVAINLPQSVENADIVLLSIPLDQIKDTLAIIARDLKEGAVVIDTAPVKEIVAQWASQLLPNRRYYVGLTPVLNPAYLRSAEAGVESARADLFRDGVIAVVSPRGASSEAIRLATDFVHLLGADHMFADAVEMDSLMAATHLLPQILSALLLDVTVDQPGWREARKVAGRAYANVSAPLAEADGPEALIAAARSTPVNMLRVLDSAIASLQTFRAGLLDEDPTPLVKRLQHAGEGGRRWWIQRQQANWSADESTSRETPSYTSIGERLLGSLGKKPKGKK